MTLLERPPHGFEIARVLGSVVVRLQGELTPAAARQLRPLLADLVDGQGNLHLVLDLRRVSRVHAVAVALFEEAGRSLADRGGELLVRPPVLASANRAVLPLADVARLVGG